MSTSLLQLSLDKLVKTNLLIFEILLLICIIVPLLYYSRGRVPQIRKLPQVDTLTEFTSACAEKGRPIQVLLCGYKHSGISAMNAYLLIIRWIAERCATLKIRLIGTASPGGYTPVGWGERSLLLYQDYARQGYISAGVPEAFNANDIRFIPNPGANPEQYTVNVLENISTLKREKPATIVVLGNVGNTQMTMWAVTSGMDILTMAMTDEGYQAGQQALVCDSSTDASEMQPIAAYISGDPAMSSAMVAADAQSYFLLVGLVAFTIRVLLLGKW